MSLLPNTCFDTPAGRQAMGMIGGADKIIDVGAGIRPVAYPAKHHLCIEPFKVYADILRKAGYKVVQGTAERVRGRKADLVFMLDVIEHMDRDTGAKVLGYAQSAGRVVIYTPMGFTEQVGDAWGLGGDEWQLHRSGWLPEDFPGWTVIPARKNRAFFAIS